MHLIHASIYYIECLKIIVINVMQSTCIICTYRQPGTGQMQSIALHIQTCGYVPETSSNQTLYNTSPLIHPPSWAAGPRPLAHAPPPSHPPLASSSLACTTGPVASNMYMYIYNILLLHWCRYTLIQISNCWIILHALVPQPIMLPMHYNPTVSVKVVVPCITSPHLIRLLLAGRLGVSD